MTAKHIKHSIGNKKYTKESKESKAQSSRNCSTNMEINTANNDLSSN